MSEGSVTALAVQPAPALVAVYEPRSYEDATRMATSFAKSGLLGVINTPEKALMVMATGAELGIPPSTALRSIDVIEGKVSLSADLKVALCLRRTDLCEYFKCISSDEKQATYETKRRGNEKPEQCTYTIEDARKAGLVRPGSNWDKRPRVMLRHRASSELATQVYPDIVLGLLTTDEMEEVIEVNRAESQPAPQIVAQPLTAAAPQDAEFSESKPTGSGEPIEAARDRWKETLESCRTSAEADKVMREVAQKFPDKKAPERAQVNEWYRAACARLKHGKPAAAPQQEIPIDKPKSAPPVEREPGSDDE